MFVRLRALRPLDRLTPREREVSSMLVEGNTHRQIAQRLGVSPNTARSHIHSLYRRLGVANRSQLARAVLAIGAGSGIRSGGEAQATDLEGTRAAD